MLRIDRVNAQVDILPGTGQTPGAGAAAPPSAATILADPQTRERIKELVQEALREHLRELERRGVV